MESYVANIFLRKKLIRKIVGDWAWERGRNKGIINESFDEFQSNSHNLHLEIAKFSRGWTATKADIVITPSKHLAKVVENWGCPNVGDYFNMDGILHFHTIEEMEELMALFLGELRAVLLSIWGGL